MDDAKTIRLHLKSLEAKLAPLSTLRAEAKTDSNRMSAFGKDLLACAKKHGIKQADMARLLDITPGAVSQHYNK